MRPAEATSTDNAVAISKPASRRVLDSATGQFAAVLSATRRSSVRLLDALQAGPGGSASGARAEGGDRAAELAKHEDAERTDETTGRGQADDPTKADQLKSKAKRASDAERMNRESARTPNKESAAANSQTAEAPQSSSFAHGAWQAGGESSPTAASLAPPADAPGGAAGAATAMQPIGGPSPIAPGPNASTDAGRMSAGSVGTSVTPSAPAPAANASASGQGGSGQQAEASAGVKPVPTTGARSSGSATEFQSLLQQLARPRLGESTGSAVATAKLKQSAASAEKPLNLASTESVEELARVVRSQAGGRNSSMTLTMSPAELGRLRIDVQMQDEAVSLRFETETVAGHEAIKGRLDELKHALAQHGVQIDRLEVNLAPAAPAQITSHDGSDAQSFNASQWGMSQQDDSSAGQARQSYDEPRQGFGEHGGFEPAAVGAGGSGPVTDWNWNSAGVDVIA